MELLLNSSKTVSDPVVQSLVRKRDLLLKGDACHKKIRTLLFVGGGGMRGAYGAGVLYAMHLLGLQDVFDTVVGVSTGAASAGYFLSGKGKCLNGASGYYESLRKALGLTELHHAAERIIGGMETDKRYMFNFDAISHHRSKFYVGTTCWETGKGHFLDVQEEQNPLRAIEASISIAELSRKPVIMSNGMRLTDGSHALTFPMEKLVEKFAPNNVLIIANCSREYAYTNPGVIAKLMGKLFGFGLPTHLHQLSCQRSEFWRRGLDYLECSRVDFKVVWAPLGIGKLTTNRILIRDTVARGAREFLDLCGETNFGFYLPP